MKWPMGLALALLAGVLPQPSGKQPVANLRAMDVHYSPADQEVHRYSYVPFDVPAGTTRIRISYRYDRAGGLNAVDLGVLEPGPTAVGAATFRGWTGGAADAIVIGVDDASPGYWAGPLPSGRWNVMFGLYKVAANGVDVHLTVETSAEPGLSQAKAVASVAGRSEAIVRRAGWYSGVLHVHTVHSDGALTPAAIFEKARSEGLDFLAITDHNNTAHQQDAVPPPGLLLITGEEVTTPGGHFNVWGLGGERDMVEFRVFPGDPLLSSIMNDVHLRGGLIGINHPAADCLACPWTHQVPDAVDAIEIANGTAAERQQARGMWDGLLRAGRRIVGIDGSDWHRGQTPLSRPAVRVWSDELSARGILDGIRHGRVVVLDDAKLPAPELEIAAGGRRARVGDSISTSSGSEVTASLTAPPGEYADARIDLLWNGEVIATAPLASARTTFVRHPVQSGYFRAHVVKRDGTMLAVTNPVYVVVD